MTPQGATVLHNDKFEASIDSAMTWQQPGYRDTYKEGRSSKLRSETASKTGALTRQNFTRGPGVLMHVPALACGPR